MNFKAWDLSSCSYHTASKLLRVSTGALFKSRLGILIRGKCAITSHETILCTNHIFTQNVAGTCFLCNHFNAEWPRRETKVGLLLHAKCAHTLFRSSLYTSTILGTDTASVHKTSARQAVYDLFRRGMARDVPPGDSGARRRVDCERSAVVTFCFFFCRDEPER